MNRAWSVILAAGMAIAAYATTRGSDGELLGALLAFGIIAIVAWLVRWIWLPYPSLGSALLELAFCEGAVIAALAIDPQLDEMAGMLNLIIPAFVLGIVVVAYVGSVIIRAFQGSKTRTSG